MAGVLDGVRVVEQGTFITGPAAAMLLGDLGADVVKVEQPGSGDPFRAYKGSLYAPHFQAWNRNKRSVTLDTRDARDLEAFDELVRGADVYIQNFRPGVAQRLNTGAERLRAINPRLVYCSISGFGPTGPAAQRPAYDGVAQAASGLLHLMVAPEHPRAMGPALADSLTGLYAAYGILGALHERARTGQGRLVELSMLEAMCHFNLDAFTHHYQAGEVMGPYARASVSQTYVMQCAHGKRLALHLSSPEKFWLGLVKVIERPDLLADPRFATRELRIAHQADLIELLSGIFVSRDRAAWCERLLAHDVPHAPMYDASEALDDPQARHLGLLVSAEHESMGTFRTVRSPVRYDGQATSTVRPPPLLGEHNEAVLGALGASASGPIQANALRNSTAHSPTPDTASSSTFPIVMNP